MLRDMTFTKEPRQLVTINVRDHVVFVGGIPCLHRQGMSTSRHGQTAV
jgi:hypothetical protein